MWDVACVYGILFGHYYPYIDGQPASDRITKFEFKLNGRMPCPELVIEDIRISCIVIDLAIDPYENGEWTQHAYYANFIGLYDQDVDVIFVGFDDIDMNSEHEYGDKLSRRMSMLQGSIISKDISHRGSYFNTAIRSIFIINAPMRFRIIREGKISGELVLSYKEDINMEEF